MFFVPSFLTGFLLLSLSPEALFAAIPKDSIRQSLKQSGAGPQLSSQAEDVVMALRLPKENRLQVLKAKGPSVAAILGQLAESDSQTLNVRWRALMAAAELHPKQSEALLARAVDRPEWYLRNAALVASVHLPREKTIAWATKRLNDPSLVVRTAAVQAIEKVRGIETEDKLWESLNAPINFKNGESLWVRRHIARTLAHFARRGQEARFVGLLQDRDVRLHVHGVQALRRITGKLNEEESRPISVQRRSWLEWWTQTNGGEREIKSSAGRAG